MQINKILDANIQPDTTLDCMKELLTYTAIDVVCEFYGVMKDNKNSLVDYLDKWVEREDHIKVIDEYFTSIWMPIPWWFLQYKHNMWYGNTNAWGTEETGSKINDDDWVMETPKRAPTKPKARTNRSTNK